MISGGCRLPSDHRQGSGRHLKGGSDPRQEPLDLRGSRERERTCMGMDNASRERKSTLNITCITFQLDKDTMINTIYTNINASFFSY